MFKKGFCTYVTKLVAQSDYNQIEKKEEALQKIDQFCTLLQSDQPPLVIDVREASEWAQAHLDCAMHIPLSDLESQIGIISRDRVVIVYCKSGRRSLSAVNLLHKNELPRSRSLKGGLDAWIALTDKHLVMVRQ